MKQDWSVEQILKEIKPLLTETEYKVFELFLQGYSLRQIAKELKINQNSLPALLIYIGKKLKEIELKEGGIL